MKMFKQFKIEAILRQSISLSILIVIKKINVQLIYLNILLITYTHSFYQLLYIIYVFIFPLVFVVVFVRRGFLYFYDEPHAYTVIRLCTSIN